MKIKELFLPGLLYGAAAVGILVYGITEGNDTIALSPLGQLGLLLAVCLCAYLAGRLLCRNKKVNRTKVMKRTFWFLLVLYLIFLFTITLFDPAYGRTGTESFLFADKATMEAYLQEAVNLRPFETILRYVRAYRENLLSDETIAVNLVGNFTALMPLALLLPLAWEKAKNFIVFFLCSTGLVALIEGLQLLFMTGHCDIDDLILNVSGALIAFLLLQIPPLKKLMKKLTY